MACPQPEFDDPAGRSPAPGRTRRRAPRKATAKHLENVALWYLARFQATARSLERVLERRVLASARHHGTDAAEGRALIADLIGRYRRSGLLDDAAFAQARALTLHQRGISLRAIKARLTEKGVAEPEIDAALRTIAENADADTPPDLEAARRTARRRRLGPWRRVDLREVRREKDLAALARAGFSYSVAKTVIDGER
jgi:regulatory protein